MIRPEEPVHIKGYLRQRGAGRLKRIKGQAILEITGPGDREWRYPLTINGAGSVYHLFEDPKRPTGEYHAALIYDKEYCGELSFKLEAYRLPRFEVRLHAPDITGLVIV